MVPISLLRDFASRPVEGGGMTDGLVMADLGVAAGRLCHASELPDAIHVPARGNVALPRLAEAHVHLDKSETIHETGAGDGTLMGAIGTLGPAMHTWDVDHFRTRMTRAVDQALTAGVGTMRSHIDCMLLPEDKPGWHAIKDVMSEYEGRMRITPVALAALDRAMIDGFDTRCKQVARAGGVLGAFIPPDGAAPEVLDRFLQGAARYALDVDFHVDEHLCDTPPATLALAEAVVRTGYEGRVLAGHACRLGLLPADDLDRALDLIAQSGIAIATLPRTNLYLQDRQQARTPKQRGMAPVREMSARGVPIVIATDNVRDAFFPFGNYDLLSVFADAAYALHLDHELGHWIRSITDIPARVLGDTDGGLLASGAPADLLLVPARNWSALLTAPPQERTVLIAGRDRAVGGMNTITPKEIAL
ncbi:amidohydrolase family protein [Rhodophyticola sp. CCM32]|uniref:amidohydrolase family protein n=1 Tax=Rhodophyticola sp. CCM32 TaxID=2916397 RepID=UPI00143D0794|nr:amidohydrolase family protein [Rhodophyticola sp. CCM32]